MLWISSCWVVGASRWAPEGLRGLWQGAGGPHVVNFQGHVAAPGQGRICQSRKDPVLGTRAGVTSPTLVSPTADRL